MDGVTALRERLAASVQQMRASPVRIVAVIIVAILIFAALTIILMATEPDHSFQVTCLQTQGREGNLVVVSGLGVLRPSVEAVIAVVDEDGLPVANATVEVTGSDSKSAAETDAAGLVTISFVKMMEPSVQTVYAGVKVTKDNFKTYDDDWFITITRL